MYIRTAKLILVFSICAFADTSVWLNDGVPGSSKRITNAVDGPASTIRLTIAGHGFSTNDKINVDGVGGCYRANGTRTVTVVDANTIDIKGRDGTTLLECGGTYRAPNASGSSGSRYYTAAKLTGYQLKDNPNVYGFDGPSGTLTTALQTRAKVGNPAYDAMKSRADLSLGSGASSYSLSNTPANPGAPFAAAMLWHAHGRSTCSGGTISTRANGSKFCTTDATWEYLDMARWWINRAEHAGRGPGCDESFANCARSVEMDQFEVYLDQYGKAYSVIRDALTSDERAAFANKMLNDVKLNNTSEAGCTNIYVKQTGSTASGTNGTTFITLSVAADAANATVGHQIRLKNSSNVLVGVAYTVTAVNDIAGRIDFTPALSATYSGITWYTVAPWVSTNCGHLWLQEHFDYNVLSTRDAYPPTGGNVYSWVSNLALWRLDSYSQIGAVLCQDDVRGCGLFERAQAFYNDQALNHAKNLWTGFIQSGSGYYQGRVVGPMANIANTLKNGLIPSLDTTGGVWLKRSLLRQIYDGLPGASNAQHTHGWGENSVRQKSLYDMNHVQATIGVVSSTDEAARMRHWLFNRFPYTQAGLETNGGLYAADSFMNVDPEATRTDYTTLSKQYLFQETDFDTVPQNYLGAYSKTGWGNSDTSILMLGGGSWEDHWQFRSTGTYHIFNGNYLVADDRDVSMNTCVLASGCYSNESDRSSSLILGQPSSTTDAFHYPWQDNKFDPLLPRQGSYVEMKRWMGTNPTGHVDNDAVHFTYDAKLAADTSRIGASVTRALHAFTHIKGGGRDYLFRYTDAATSAAVKHRRPLHFPNNGGTGEGATSMGGDGVIYTTTNSGTSMHATILYPANPAITDISIRRTNNTTLTINSDATVSNPVRYKATGFDCTYTAPGTVVLDSASTTGVIYLYIASGGCTITAGYTTQTIANTTGGVGTASGISAYPAGSGALLRWNVSGTGTWNTTAYIKDGGIYNATTNTRRFILDSGTVAASEVLEIYEPHGNQVDDDAPKSLTETADWLTGQVSHATLSAVAAFPRGNECKNSWIHTSNHLGTSEYVLAGLCSGNYTRTLNGGAATSVLVSSGDETMKWYGAAGEYVVTRVGEGPPITTASLPSGKVGTPYSATLEGVVSGTATWTVVSGSLPAGLSLNAMTGEIAGTPSAAGTSQFRIRLTDSATSLSTERDFSIDIAENAPDLIFSPPALVTCTIGGNCNPSLTSSANGGTPPYSYSASGEPAGVTLNSDGSWTLDSSTAAPGDYNPPVTVTDNAMASSPATPVLIRVVTNSSAADFSIEGSVMGANSGMIRISRVGFNANATISAVLRSSNGEVAASFTFPPNLATRFEFVSGLSPGTAYTLQAAGDSNAVYGTVTTTAAPRTNISVPIVVFKRAGMTHIRIRYGSTPALGTTSPITACDADYCSLTLTRDEGPLYRIIDRCSEETCASPLKPDEIMQSSFIK